MDTTTLVVIVAVVVVILIAAVAVMSARRQRSGHLRGHFGPEYDRLVQETGSERAAERELLERRHRFKKLELRSLSVEERRSFGERWQLAQAHFVDEPSGAVNEAQSLVEETMQARGYPLGDWDQREADVSVERPDVVRQFREARDVARRNKRGEASTEDLRNAMIHYRELFEGLLEGSASQPVTENQPTPREIPHEDRRRLR